MIKNFLSPNPAASSNCSQCHVTYCHACYNYNLWNPITSLPGNCGKCQLKDFKGNVLKRNRCFRRWANCIRRAHNRKYAMVSVMEKVCMQSNLRTCSGPSPLSLVERLSSFGGYFVGSVYKRGSVYRRGPLKLSFVFDLFLERFHCIACCKINYNDALSQEGWNVPILYGRVPGFN